jgi:hypothetical protein
VWSIPEWEPVRCGTADSGGRACSRLRLAEKARLGKSSRARIAAMLAPSELCESLARCGALAASAALSKRAADNGLLMRMSPSPASMLVVNAGAGRGWDGSTPGAYAGSGLHAAAAGGASRALVSCRARGSRLALSTEVAPLLAPQPASPPLALPALALLPPLSLLAPPPPRAQLQAASPQLTLSGAATASRGGGAPKVGLGWASRKLAALVPQFDDERREPASDWLAYSERETER